MVSYDDLEDYTGPLAGNGAFMQPTEQVDFCSNGRSLADHLHDLRCHRYALMRRSEENLINDIEMASKTTAASEIPENGYREVLIKDNTLCQMLLSKEETTTPLTPKRPPEAALGLLARLPLELLKDICLMLDLRSIQDLRSVNRRARDVVESNHAFRMIMLQANLILRCVNGVQAAKLYTAEGLFEKLCTRACEVCGDFGGYIHLLEPKRVCFLCQRASEIYLYESCKFLRSIEAGTNTGKYLDRCILTRPGCYGPSPVRESDGMEISPSVRYRSLELLDVRQPRTNHSRVDPADEERLFLLDYQMKLMRNGEMGRRIQLIATERHPLGGHPALNPKLFPPKFVREFREGQSAGQKWGYPLPHVHIHAYGYARHLMGLVEAPVLDPNTGCAEWGFHCVGCRNEFEKPKHYRRKFDAKSFDEHLKEVGQIFNKEHHKCS